MIAQVFIGEEKAVISRQILEALPEWFGILEARERYISDSENQLFFQAKADNKVVGFLCLKETGKDTVELAVIINGKRNCRK